MSVNAEIHDIERAEAHTSGRHSWVWVFSGQSRMTLHFGSGMGALAAASAINAAVAFSKLGEDREE